MLKEPGHPHGFAQEVVNGLAFNRFHLSIPGQELRLFLKRHLLGDHQEIMRLGLLGVCYELLIVGCLCHFFLFLSYTIRLNVGFGGVYFSCSSFRGTNVNSGCLAGMVSTSNTSSGWTR